MQFHHNSYMLAVYFNILINLVTLPMLTWLVPESPYFLYQQDRMKEFYASLLLLQKMSNCWCFSPSGSDGNQ